MGGASPRKGLFKAQKPKLSKTAHQKLRDSLKIFDFDSESESDSEEVETVVKKPVKPRATPLVAKSTEEGSEVKGEEGSASTKPENNSNYRYGVYTVHDVHTVHDVRVCL